MLYRTKNPHGGDVYNKPVKLDFSANTNPYGTAPGVLEAVSQSLPLMHQYPDPYCHELVQAISEFEGVPEEYILCGNGAAELIYSYCYAIRPELAVELAPTFSEYSLALERIGCRLERYTLYEKNDFTLDEGFLAYLTDRKPQAVFLCNPNNPTGMCIERSLLLEILKTCEERNIYLFLDECFIDLTERAESMKEYLADHKQLFILKAFTKSYGMAGIRLGYCLSTDQELLSEMSATTQPWNVSIPAQAAGVAALQEQAFLQKARATIFTEKKWLIQELRNLALRVCPSEANYLFFKGPPGLHSDLEEEGISIRNCDNYYGLSPGWYRIAVRLHQDNEMLISAMKRIKRKD